MAVTLAEMCDGIKETLSGATGIQWSATYNELTEGISSLDCPMIEVYPQAGTCDPSGRADRTTFKAGAQLSVITIFVDLYARQRSELGEDMGETVTMLDALMVVLQQQEVPPFFGVAGIKAFSWSWRRAVHRRAGGHYVGARFTNLLRIF